MNEQQAYEEYQAGIDEAQGQEAEAMAALSAQAEAENANAQAMNEDILLTDEEIYKAVNPHTQAPYRQRYVNSSDRAIASAQLAKVHKWLDEQPWLDVVMDDRVWQALRAAGGVK